MPAHNWSADLDSRESALADSLSAEIAADDPALAKAPEPVRHRRAADRHLDDLKLLLERAGVDPILYCDIVCAAIDYGTARAIRALDGLDLRLNRSAS